MNSLLEQITDLRLVIIGLDQVFVVDESHKFLVVAFELLNKRLQIVQLTLIGFNIRQLLAIFKSKLIVVSHH